MLRVAVAAASRGASGRSLCCYGGGRVDYAPKSSRRCHSSSSFQYDPPPPPSASSDKPFYVTTPIFYVNAEPHIGHLHSGLIADVLARYHAFRTAGYTLRSTSSRQSRVQPVFSTGTDEHGLKIQKVAEAAGEDPKALCDRISLRFRDLASAANLSHTRFIRTTEPEHAVAVKEIWRRLQEGGYIYKGEHSGWYAVSDEAFYTDQQVQERVDPKTGEKYMEAIETGQRVEWSSEENYKFRLSLFRDALLTYHRTPIPTFTTRSNQDSSTVQPNQRQLHPLQPPPQRTALIAELESGPLADLSISRPRSRLHWGIPVPGDEENHTIYVWIDALVNYLTVTGFPWAADKGGDGTGRAEWEGSAWPPDVHVVGKDIVRFHAIYWPAMLMAAKLPLPRHILAHAHWTKNRMKMSKSSGNVADPFAALQEFRPPPPSPPTQEDNAVTPAQDNAVTTSTDQEGGSADVLRWLLMRHGGNLASDADYSENLMRGFYRKHLQGQIGNLASRAMAPIVLERLLPSTSKPETEAQTETETETERTAIVDDQQTVGSVKVPVVVNRPADVHPDDAELHSQLENMGAAFDAHMERFKITSALHVVHDAVAAANELISRLEPWASATPRSAIERAVYYSAETLRLGALLLGSTVMPGRMGALLDIVAPSSAPDQGENGTDRFAGLDWETETQLREQFTLYMLKEADSGQACKIAPLFPTLAPGPQPAPRVKADASSESGSGPMKKKVWKNANATGRGQHKHKQRRTR